MFFIHGFDGTCRHERPHANEFKIQPSGVLRHFGHFHLYDGTLKGHFNKHISTPEPNPPRSLLQSDTYNYSLLVRLCNCSVCAQDSTIP